MVNAINKLMIELIVVDHQQCVICYWRSLMRWHLLSVPANVTYLHVSRQDASNKGSKTVWILWGELLRLYCMRLREGVLRPSPPSRDCYYSKHKWFIFLLSQTISLVCLKCVRLSCGKEAFLRSMYIWRLKNLDLRCWLPCVGPCRLYRDSYLSPLKRSGKCSLPWPT